MKHILSILLFLLIGTANAQITFGIKDGMAYMTIPTDLPSEAIDSVMSSCGFADSVLNSLKIGFTSSAEWELVSKDDLHIKLKKNLKDFTGQYSKDLSLIFKKMSENTNQSSSIDDFGYNPKTLFHIRELNNGKTRFELAGFPDAKEVILSGSFVDWSTLKLPMEKNGTGWQIDIELKEGVYAYKFIVDGHWMVDPKNEQKRADQHGYVNSIYVKPNYTFKLDGFTDAKKVILSGTFNDWNEHGTKMKPTYIGWELPVYLEDGTYSYKYIVDGKWMQDPGNSQTNRTAHGYENSILSIGNPTEFYLADFKNSHDVVLAGSFNNWNETDLTLDRAKGGWSLDYVLPPGNYEYKYIVDGRWMLPPDCDIKVGEGDLINCVKVVEPNYTFKLDGHLDAKNVRLSGSFNDWQNPGYSMHKSETGWEVSIHLKEGKHTYQFVIDDQWQSDPGNPQYEQNEFGGKNSVIWLDL